MPLDLNQLAPVALWRTEYAVEGGTRVEWTTDVPLKSIWTNSCVRHETLPAATYSALVEELRAAREVARCAREMLRWWDFAIDDVPTAMLEPGVDYDAMCASAFEALRAALSGVAS